MQKSSGNPHSMRAPELEVNCLANKMEEIRIQKIQNKAQNAKITDDFKDGYPDYQAILEKYTPSMIFAGRKLAERENKMIESANTSAQVRSM